MNCSHRKTGWCIECAQNFNNIFLKGGTFTTSVKLDSSDFKSLPNYDPDANPAQREATNNVRWRHPSIDDVKLQFHKAVQNGLIQFAKTISSEQVRHMLDPAPRDMIASHTFELKEVPIKHLHTIGSRYFTASLSLGPIIVDLDAELGILVIDGKHRVLDAQDRGEDTILAWVGDKINKS